MSFAIGQSVCVGASVPPLKLMGGARLTIAGAAGKVLALPQDRVDVELDASKITLRFAPGELEPRLP